MQNIINQEEATEILQILKDRFAKNMKRHKNIEWADVESRLIEKPNNLVVLSRMENTGGEPDVVVFNNSSDEIIFVDCSAESPKGRRSFCYDRAALDARKEFKPENSAIDAASEIGIEMLNEMEYRKVQEDGPLDTKTSRWILTPDSYRKLGGALFSEFRYGAVFGFHNWVQYYYAASGVRGKLVI